MGARAVLERPPDLRKFLVETLTEMKSSGNKASMGMFSSEDLETMFDMWDELQAGTIPTLKVAETLKALNCSPGREEEVVEKYVGADCTGVDKATFMKIVRAEL